MMMRAQRNPDIVQCRKSGHNEAKKIRAHTHRATTAAERMLHLCVGSASTVKGVWLMLVGAGCGAEGWALCADVETRVAARRQMHSANGGTSTREKVKENSRENVDAGAEGSR